MNLSSDTKLRLIKAAQVAGTSAVESTVVDMSGFEGVLLFGTINVANAGNYIKAQSGTDATVTDAADLTGTKVVCGYTGEVLWIDLYRPLERYVRMVGIRGSSTATGDFYAMLYGAHTKPTDNLEDDVIDGELHVSPAEGTA